MTLRAVFIADGSSDLALADHLRLICHGHDLHLTLATPDPARLQAKSRAVRDRVDALVRFGDPIDLLFVHRDAEAQSPTDRRNEILDGAAAAGVQVPVVPVVPVRMTEAWLLLDESSIRTVAGRPKSTVSLGLPPWHKVESVADPKALLREALLEASGATGRRRRQMVRDFDRHRGDLLRRLNPAGLVSRLQSWQQLVADIAEAAERHRRQ